MGIFPAGAGAAIKRSATERTEKSEGLRAQPVETERLEGACFSVDRRRPPPLRCPSSSNPPLEVRADARSLIGIGDESAANQQAGP